MREDASSTICPLACLFESGPICRQARSYFQSDELSHISITQQEVNGAITAGQDLNIDYLIRT